MKRSAFIFLLLALMGGLWVGYGDAVSRMAQRVFEGESWFEKVGATGGTNTGNPGYLALTATDGSGNVFTTYLYISAANKLILVSYPTASAFASFPSGDWREPACCGGTIVGSQS